MFSILIHSGFYKILRESDRPFRARVQKTLARLHSGHWANGTRVKRLAGVAQPVYEARVDRGDRLLFTAIRAADRDDPKQLTTHLQIWDVVSHDAVNRALRRNLVSEAEFLDFRSLEEFDITEPPPAPAATFDEVAADEELLLHFLVPKDGFESRAAEGITGGVRWYLAPPSILADDAEFQRLMDDGGGELELKLMRDQYAVLRSPGPLLLAGSAGSGKTTIAIHRLVEARQQLETAQILYLSYSPWLVDYARNLYRDVMVARGGDPRALPPAFTTFAELYRRLIPAKESEHAATLTDRDSFAAWFRRSGLRLDSALVWEEIRSILKGACLNLGRAMLEQREYEDLGRKRAPLFVNERPEIFSIAQRYQQWLAKESRVDQIDLCRRAFREVRHGRGRKYDVVVCDEIQDLTELEVGFVLSLSANPNLRGVMLAGDTQQIVNPSGFRWAEARQSAMKIAGTRTAPALARLRRNCRSARPLVELANSVLALRQQIFGRYEEDTIEDAVADGPSPIQVAEDEKRVLDAIRDFGPRCAILVLDEAELRSLSSRLDTTRIFLVRDAKGLEFDTVVLWKLMQSESGTIERFLRSDMRAEKDARLRQFLQHLYVAVTRARRHLAVYEGPAPHPFWNQSRFRHQLEVETAATLGRLFRESASTAEWTKEGDYYAERMRHRQAAECYRRAGAEDKETAAMAMFAESVEDWSGALDRWQRIARLDRQGILLEKLGRLAEAVEIFKQLGQAADAWRLETRLLEKQGRWGEAGKRWEDAGNAAEASRCYQRAGNSARALALEATAAEQEGNWKRAAQCWFELKSYEAAARCFRKSKDAKGSAAAAALHYDSIKEWSKAAASYKRAGDKPKSDDRRARAMEASGKLREAAKLRERLGQPEHALQLYKKAGDAEAIDRISVERADVREPQTDRIAGLQERGKLKLAIELARKRRLWLSKRIIHRRRSFFVTTTPDETEYYGLQDRIHACEAARAEQRRNWKKAATLWHKCREFERADQARMKAVEALPNPGERGLAWLRLGEFEKAVAMYQMAGDSKHATMANALLCERREEWQRGAELWQSIGYAKQHAACMAQFARTSGDFEDAARWHRQAGQQTLAAQAEREARRARSGKAPHRRASQPELF